MTRARNSANLASQGNLFVDITNDRTGIGSVVPAQNLHVAGTAGFHADVTFTGDNARSTFWDRSSGFLKFNDNAYIKMGTSNDMSIYHDGTNNIIAAVPPKNLLLQSDDLQLQDCSNSHPYVKCVRDSYVRLYHDNSTRFQTAAYGVNVTGTTDTDGLVVSGVATVTTMNVTGVLTYEDVTSVDSVGIITARAGLVVSGGTVTIPTVAGTNTNAALNVLFQTAAGVIDGGSALTYNPAQDVLSVNGNHISSQTFRGDGNLGTLTCDNYSSSTSVNVSNTVDILTVDNATNAFTLKQGSNEYITVDTTNSSELITLGNNTTNPNVSILAGNVTISGNLTVTGTTTQNNSVSTTEKIITLASGSANNAAVDGAGIVIDAGSDTDKTLKWLDNTDRWTFTGGDVAANAFHGDGSNLTGLNVAITAINNAANNRVVTSNGGTTVNSEANLTFTGSILTVTNSSGAAELTLVTPNNTDSGVYFNDGSNSGAISYQHSDDSMRFRVNTQERLRITSDGKVGVNRTPTQHPLEIQHASEPTVSFWRGSTKGAALQAQSGGTYLYSYENAPLLFSVNSAQGFTERLRITSDGDMGLGTNSPARRFHQHINSSAANYHSFTNSTTGAAASDGLLLGINSAEEAIFWNYENTDMRFATYGNERLRITSSGHALFSGLTTKNDPRNDKGITIKSVSGGGGVSFENFGGNGSRNWRIRPDDLTGWGALEFSVSPTANSNTDWPDAATDVVLSLEPDKDVIVRNGKLGISETSPTNPLHIKNTTSDVGILIKTTSNNYHTICGDANRTQAEDNILRLDSKWNGTVVNRIRMLAGNDTTNKDDGIICFDTASGGSMGERFRIKSDGTIKIGGTSGFTATDIPLQVHNPLGSSSQMQFTGTSTGATTTSRGFRVGYNGSGGQVWNFENTYIRFATNNTERMHIRADGKVSIGDSPSTYNNSYLRIEAPGINVESEWDADDNQGSSPHLSLFGSNSHVRMDMGTMDVGPYGVYIQSRFDNTPEEGGTTSSGLEPLLLNPRGGALMYNIHDQDAVNGIGGGQGGTKGGFVMRAGSADSATVSNANTAIKIYPGHVRSSTPVSEQNGGVKYGGIAWNVLDPHNGGWGAYNGSHCWMGMSLHSTPGQELSNWQVQMNQSGNTGSTPTNVALQATPHGYVTKPCNPAFMAMCTGSTLTTSGGSSFDMPADNEIFDTMNNYNTSNYRFTAPTDGKYFFWYNLFIYGTQSGENRWNFKKNGSDYHSLQSVMNFNNYNPWNGAIVMDLSKNDYVTCGQWQSYNGLSFYRGHTGWGGYMVG